MDIVRNIPTKRKWNIIWDFHSKCFFVYKYGNFIKSFSDSWDEANSWIECEEEFEHQDRIDGD